MRTVPEERAQRASRRIAIVPDAPVLWPEHASLVDPAPELRAAVAEATAWADRVVHLNGSARRTTTSPGPYDERAVPFDDALFAALTAPDLAALRAIDPTLAGELWADVAAAGALADLLEGQRWSVRVRYDDAPYGVAWWVLCYERTHG
jgi:hypothetical protein